MPELPPRDQSDFARQSSDKFSCLPSRLFGNSFDDTERARGRDDAAEPETRLREQG